METTPRAEGLADAVRDVLARVEATISTQPAFVPAESTRAFRLLVANYALSTLMPHVLAWVYKDAPGIRIDLRPEVAYPERALERADADMLTIPQEYCSSEHPTEVLLEEDFCCVMWKDAPLASEPLTRERYLAVGHIVVVPGQGQPAVEDGFIKRLGVSRRVEVTTFSFAAPAQMVVGTQRVATMHRRLASRCSAASPLRSGTFRCRYLSCSKPCSGTHIARRTRVFVGCGRYSKNQSLRWTAVLCERR